MDYKNAKIYQLVNDITDDVYIGSTCQPLSKRIAEHRASMRSKRDSHLKLYQKMLEIGVEHFNIYLVKETPCENKEQLRAIEGEYIRERGTLNGHIAGRNMKTHGKEMNDIHREKYREVRQSYTINNKDKLTEYGQKYRNDRKEELNQKERDRYTEMTKIKLTCTICGAKHNKKNTPLHFRSRRHQDALNTLSINDEQYENISDNI